MTDRPRILDLYCGAGGASMGLYRAGFDVEGVDIKPQKHYPFPFHQADALTFPLEGYAAYWASPPCQYYSRLRHLPWLKDRVYWRSVPPTRERLLTTSKPWVIENVEDCGDMPNSFVLCGASIGLSLYRHRRFETTFPVFLPSHQKHKRVIVSGRASLAKRRHGQQGFKEINRDSIAGKGNYKGDAERRRTVMQIDWMTSEELAQAIPPAYSEYIGKFLMQAVRGD